MVSGSVLDVEAIFNDSHYAAREAIATVTDPDLGELRMPAPIPKLSATPGRIKWSGRQPGADNDFVYKELLGIDDDKLARLRSANII